LVPHINTQPWVPGRLTTFKPSLQFHLFISDAEVGAPTTESCYRDMVCITFYLSFYSGRLFLEVEINMDLHFLEICSLSASIYHARDLKDFCVATELNSLMLYFVF
jgi:hypothetical protein